VHFGLLEETLSEPNPDERPAIAAAVIVEDGHVLLVRRRVAEGDLSWQFPGGAVEAGETWEAAAVRETEEETGLSVLASGVLGRRVHPGSGRTMIYVACDVAAGTADVGHDDEIAEVVWCGRDSLASYVPHPFHGPVQDYLDANLSP
jgi:8-oxo-dGTP diphosphatase